MESACKQCKVESASKESAGKTGRAINSCLHRYIPNKVETNTENMHLSCGTESANFIKDDIATY